MMYDVWLYSPLVFDYLTAPNAARCMVLRTVVLRWSVPFTHVYSARAWTTPGHLSGARIEGTVGRQTPVGGIEESCVRWHRIHHLSFFSTPVLG